ncbi:MAG: oxidoreductase [Cellvibrionaceae bacterium]|nr:oxidoreductase [Cellvibrionaceae bacterium]
MSWQLSDIPDLSSKVAVVTGGNIGLGFQSSLQLSKNGATVIIACRSKEKGQRAVERILQQQPSAKLDVIELDLCDLKSVAQFSQQFSQRYAQLDILLNNAGVVNLAERSLSPAGHEMHLATNHYGHFALTLALFPQILNSPSARVVTVSSAGYKAGEIRFDDLDWHQREYNRIKSYGDSKLANLLFTEKLQRVFEALGSTAISVAAHPGLTGTERQQSIGVGGALARFLASPVEKGVRPQLLAATSAAVVGGDFYGPRFGLGGAVKNNAQVISKLDKSLADELWRHSCETCEIKSPV